MVPQWDLFFCALMVSSVLTGHWMRFVMCVTGSPGKGHYRGHGGTDFDTDIILEPELIGSRFRVPGSRVTTDGHCSQYWSRSRIPDITHWVKWLYNHDEDKIPLTKTGWGFLTRNFEPWTAQPRLKISTPFNSQYSGFLHHHPPPLVFLIPLSYLNFPWTWDITPKFKLGWNIDKLVWQDIPDLYLWLIL